METDLFTLGIIGPSEQFFFKRKSTIVLEERETQGKISKIDETVKRLTVCENKRRSLKMFDVLKRRNIGHDQ